MLHFDCDYMEGAHPEVMRRLAETNLEQSAGYVATPIRNTPGTHPPGL
ncbi:hypothetical protein LEA_04218, partial [human gut metagenome]